MPEKDSRESADAATVARGPQPRHLPCERAGPPAPERIGPTFAAGLGVRVVHSRDLIGLPMDCARLPKCPFFNGQLAAVPATAELFRRNYCRGEPAGCARYQVANASLPVPEDLFPNDADRAKALLSAAGR